MAKSTEYKVEFVKAQKTVKAFYREGFLTRITHLDGIDSKLFQFLFRAIPVLEKDVSIYASNYANRVFYTKRDGVKAAYSLHRKMTGAWFSFYQNKFGVSPKHGATEGKALKGILTYLLTQSKGNEETALLVWNTLLDSWETLDLFTQSKTDLLYINSKLNLIIPQLQENVGSYSDSNTRTL